MKILEQCKIVKILSKITVTFDQLKAYKTRSICSLSPNLLMG